MYVSQKNIMKYATKEKDATLFDKIISTNLKKNMNEKPYIRKVTI